jgi:hypothetical protein
MKKILSVATAAALVFGLSACGEEVQDDNYVGVCQDKQGNRVDDSLCAGAPAYGGASGGGSTIEGFFWGYLLSSMMMPRIGQPVGNTVVYRVDESRYNVYRGGVSKTGGRINYDTYKPIASKVVKPDTSVKSQKYRDVYINQDSTYKNKSGSGSNNSYNYKGSSGSCCKSGGSSGGGRVGGRR